MQHSASDPTGSLDRLRREHAALYRCIDPNRARRWFQDLARSAPASDDFGESASGGRGESYIRAQALNVSARAQGICSMLELIRSGSDAPCKTVIDVLGGDGLVRRVADRLTLSDVDILTCDLSPYMVRAAWSASIPALLQRADRLLQRDTSVDGVLVAYGTHHISPEDRADVAREAYRVLRPGGVFVMHDFLTGSAMDEWFTRVVHPNSRTGHQYTHFTREEMLGYLAKAGFESYEVLDMRDPYTATAETAERAELNLGRYLLNMYGLVKVDRVQGGQADRWVIEKAREIFRYPTRSGAVEQLSVGHDPHAGAVRCTVPRMAVVGVGRKMR